MSAYSHAMDRQANHTPGDKMNSATRISSVQTRCLRVLLGLCSGVLLACGGSGPDPQPKATRLAATMTAVNVTTAAPAPGTAEANPANGLANYRVVMLGPGEVTALPAINSKGQVAFSLNGPSGYHAWFFNGATVRDLGTLGGAEAYAAALNSAGQVAGYSSGPGGSYRAFRWSPSTGMVDLGTLNGAGAAKGLAINERGQVAGYLDAALEPLKAFVWSDGSGMLDIGRLRTTLGTTVAQAINDGGMAAGFSDATTGNAHAFAWTKAGGMVDIGTVGGIDSYATLINNAGQVAGYSAVQNAAGFYYHGFVWSRATGMVDIGTLRGLGSAALALNASGQVAGVSDFNATYQHAIWWTRADGMVDLGTLGGTSSRALGINGHGVVVGLSNTRGSQSAYRAFLWTKALGMVDLNKRIRQAPAGLLVTGALAISDSGAIVAESNVGLVLLKPGEKGTDAPVVGPIAPADAVVAGRRVAFSASFTDQNSADTHTAAWSWGGAGEPGTVTENNGAGAARGQHTFAAAGVYRVTLTVTDSTGLSVMVAREVTVVKPGAR